MPFQNPAEMSFEEASGGCPILLPDTQKGGPPFGRPPSKAVSRLRLDEPVHRDKRAAGIRDSVCAFDADLSKPIFLIVGGEKRGISAKVLSTADTIVRLDYGREFNGSLSAASCASVLAYEILRQNRK